MQVASEETPTDVLGLVEKAAPSNASDDDDDNNDDDDDDDDEEMSNEHSARKHNRKDDEVPSDDELDLSNMSDLMSGSDGSDVSDGELNLSDEDAHANVSEDSDSIVANIEDGMAASESAQTGILEEITLKNFMSHRHMNMKFGPNVNFLCGPNGSGKSAVLVAISVCLGASIGFTNRGGTIADLIRNDTQTCEIRVRLANRGTDAYQPERYGDSIIVERSLFRNRSTKSQYRLLASDGTTVVNKTKKELNKILDTFNIQIDNPCVILMQDTSREFIASARAQDKYKFFQKATQLEKMSHDYIDSVKHLGLAKSSIEQKKAVLPAMAKEVALRKQEFDAAQSLVTLEETVKKLVIEASWADVRDAAEELSKLEHKQSQAADALAKLDETEARVLEMQRDRQADVEEANREISRVQLDLERAEHNVKTAHRESHQAGRGVREATANIRSHEANQGRLQKRLKRILDEIKKAQQAIEQSRNADNSVIQQRIQLLKQKLPEAEHQAAVTSQRHNEVQAKAQRVGEDVDALQQVVRDKEQEVRQCQSRVQRLRQQQGNRLRAFGDRMPALMQLIEQNRNRFRHTPQLIGMNVLIKDKAWSVAIESSLSQLLDQFVVDNHDQDAKLLRQLAQRANVRVNMVVCRFEERYQIPPASLPRVPDAPSIADVVDIATGPVFNALVDQRKVERSLLVRDKRRAYELVSRDSNLSSVFLPNGDRIFARNGTQVHLPSHVQQATKLADNVDQQIVELEAQIAHLTPAIHPAQERLNEAKSALARVRREVADCRREESRALSQLENLRDEIRDLEQEAQEKLAETEPDISELLESRDSIAQSIEEARSELSTLQEAEAAAKETLRPLLEAEQAAAAEVDQATTQLEKAQATLLQATTQLENANRRLQIVRQSKAKTVGNARAFEESRLEAERRLEQSTARAERAGERIDSERSVADLKEDIRCHQARLEKERRGADDTDVITARYVDAKRKYNKTQLDLRHLKELCMNLDHDLESRIEKWAAFRKVLAKRTRTYFNMFLSKRGSTGSITFDHEAGLLDINVQMDTSLSKETATQTTKSMSGGERSYATVALLLSLWEAMENPFRAMDEFDVFMDAANRKLTITLLMECARFNKSRQFIFISPLSVVDIETGPMVVVRRMSPPRDIGGSPVLG